MFDNQVRTIVSSGVDVRGLELLNNRHSTGSLSATDEFSSDEMLRFWMNARNIRDSQIFGSESIPGEFLKPSFYDIMLSNEMLDLMVEYYLATYVTHTFRKPLGGSNGNITIRVKINQFGRCRIGSEVFGSSISLRHIKSSYILAKFITNDGNVDCYPGQVQYYFIHTIDLPSGPTEHFLAYVRWYKHVSSENIRYHFRSDDDDDTCNVELWDTEFYHTCTSYFRSICTSELQNFNPPKCERISGCESNRQKIQFLI
jgi:hypothetical protein